MPRRIPDYPDSFAGWNYVSSFGSIISVIATCLFVYIIYNSFTSGSEVNNNPWAMPSFFVSDKELANSTPFATTLDFSVVSPIPSHVYNVLPILTEDPLLISDHGHNIKSSSV
jgi:heme/copper-type cytochrome/quinol oxidase subunit 1